VENEARASVVVHSFFKVCARGDRRDVVGRRGAHFVVTK
jgi:hypothetical protein